MPLMPRHRGQLQWYQSWYGPVVSGMGRRYTKDRRLQGDAVSGGGDGSQTSRGSHHQRSARGRHMAWGEGAAAAFRKAYRTCSSVESASGGACCRATLQHVRYHDGPASQAGPSCHARRKGACPEGPGFSVVQGEINRAGRFRCRRRSRRFREQQIPARQNRERRWRRWKWRSLHGWCRLLLPSGW